LLIVPARCGLRTRLTTALPPAGRAPRRQVTTRREIEQAPWVELAERKARPSGRGSVSTASVAASGPLLLTVTRAVNESPSRTVVGERAMVTARSAVGTPEMSDDRTR